MRRPFLQFLTRMVLLAVLCGAALLYEPSPASADTLTGVAAVSAGAVHGCALTSAGGVKCWGHNGDGQLGDGRNFDSSTPVDVTGLSSGVAMASAGAFHNCAVTAAGGVKCWGLSFGPAPVDVAGLSSGVASVSAGRSHSCAVTTAGGVRCWGSNLYGQLGNGTTTNSSTPVDVTGLTNGVAAIAAGGQYSCAITTAGGVKCWGANANGELGDGGACGTICSSPADVTGLANGVAGVAVSTGDYHVSCAVTASGGAKCWGSNQYGALGTGSSSGPETCHVASPCSRTPVDVTGLSTGVATISAADAYACAVTTAGGVKCWGSNFWGQLGNGSRVEEDTPIDVSGLTSGAAAVSTGEGQSCAVTTAHGLRCWGDNEFGQLGDGTTARRGTPVDVVATPPYSAGDVNCDGAINAIDALLVLQQEAGLLPLQPLPCQQNADTNRDHMVNAIDATLILQYSADLIHALPP
jgi:hypothetical protein